MARFGILLALIVISLSYGQEGKTPMNVDWQADAVLKDVVASLPAGWEAVTENDTLVIRRKEPVWILFENRINAPFRPETEEQRDARIRKYGLAAHAQFIFRCEERWSEAEREAARQVNCDIEKRVERLPSEFGIVHLYNAHLSSKGEPVFIGHTEEDQQRIEEYRKARDTLLQKSVRLPDYNAEKYSLFLLRKEGMEDDFYLVSPAEVSAEMYAIEAALRQKIEAWEESQR